MRTLVETNAIRPCRAIELGCGTGKYRRTPLDTVLYFSSDGEMISLFEPLFVVDEMKTIDIEGKTAPHKAIFAFMTRRG